MVFPMQSHPKKETEEKDAGFPLKTGGNDRGARAGLWPVVSGRHSRARGEHQKWRVVRSFPAHAGSHLPSARPASPPKIIPRARGEPPSDGRVRRGPTYHFPRKRDPPCSLVVPRLTRPEARSAAFPRFLCPFRTPLSFPRRREFREGLGELRVSEFTTGHLEGGIPGPPLSTSFTRGSSSRGRAFFMNSAVMMARGAARNVTKAFPNQTSIPRVVLKMDSRLKTLDRNRRGQALGMTTGEQEHGGRVHPPYVTRGVLTVKKKVDPFPGSESTQIVPLCCSTIRLQMASPMPVPG